MLWELHSSSYVLKPDGGKYISADPSKDSTGGQGQKTAEVGDMQISLALIKCIRRYSVGLAFWWVAVLAGKLAGEWSTTDNIKQSGN